MAISCDPNDLASASAGFAKCSDRGLMEIQTYLLAVKAGGSTDPTVLQLAAKDFAKCSEKELLEIQASLLCAIVNL